MRDDQRARSPQRGRDRVDDDGASRGREDERRHDDNYRSRHDYSRSPPRNNPRDDQRERAPRQRPDMGRDRDFDERYGGPDNGRRQHERSPDRSRRGRWDDRGYDTMYDDGHHYDDARSRRRYDDDAIRDDEDSRYDEQRRRSRSPPPGRYRSRSRSRTSEAGRPSDTIILEGLPFSISGIELREALLASTIAAEFPSIDVRISSSRGNRRAFVQFEDVDQAITFVKEHFPRVFLELPHSTDDVPDGKLEAYVHYARNRDEVDARPAPCGNWACPQCDFSNYSTRAKCKICGAPQSEPNWEQSLTGAEDAADAADAISQILVIYPLASFVTEDMLVKDLKLLEKSEEPKTAASGPTKLKSTAPTADASRHGARPNSLHRVFLMRDASSGESFKYAFAEFWTLEDATAAVTKFRMARSFNVAGCSVTIAPTHMGVFVPEDRDPTPKIEYMSFNPLFNPSLRVRYRDTHVFPSQSIVTSEPPPDVKVGESKSNEDEQSDSKKQKKRKADGNLAASTAKKQVPMAGQMAVWQRKHDELHVDSNGSGQARGERPDGKAPIKISLSNSTKLGAPSSSSGLSGRVPSPPAKDTPIPGSADGAGSNEGQNAETNAEGSGSEETFLDRERLMCLICMRKYKSSDEVNIHEKSRNHKTAMEDEEKVKAAQPRLAARDKRLQKQVETAGDDAQSGGQYRDRAKERRDIYKQPNKPSGVPPANKAKTESSKPAEQEPAAKPAASKGAGMLAKMGWTAGTGLGANSDGRTEAIVTNAYQEGVGLGAEGSNLGDATQLAEKKTTNKYSDYLSTVQDKARERYNQMN